MHWSASAPSHCTGRLDFNAVYAGGCVEHATHQDSDPATAMDTVVHSSNNAPTEAGVWAAPVASQAFYTYPNTADAQSAMQAITGKMLTDNGQTQDLTIENLPVVDTTTATAQFPGALAIDAEMRDTKGNPATASSAPGTSSRKSTSRSTKSPPSTTGTSPPSTTRSCPSCGRTSRPTSSERGSARSVEARRRRGQTRPEYWSIPLPALLQFAGRPRTPWDG